MKLQQHSIALLSLISTTCASLAAPLPEANAEEMFFAPERLAKIHTMVQSHLDQGKHAGAITAIARNGRIVDFKTYGFRDLENRAPIQRDTIFRIYSMSKVITSAAVLQLFEEGRINLSDPISLYIPELTNLKVCTGGTPDNPVLIDAKQPITIKHLLTHTAGFCYEFSAKEPLKQIYQKAKLLEASSLKEFIDLLATLPLAHEPGEAFTYGVNTDVLGYLIQVVSGKPLEIYLQDHIFGPLEMTDTSFDVPDEKMPRLAKIYEAGPDGKLRQVSESVLYGTYAKKGRGFPSGGGGLFSTADDYLRFAQMLLNGGSLDNKHVLGRKTVELMLANHLTHLEKWTIDSNQSEGFGLGGSVRIDLAMGNTLGSVGQFGWNGAATTTFNIDPQEGTVALLLTQHFPYDQHGIFAKFYRLFYHSMVSSAPASDL